MYYMDFKYTVFICHVNEKRINNFNLFKYSWSEECENVGYLLKFY